MEPMSPALPGGFFTTEPPGKPETHFFFLILKLHFFFFFVVVTQLFMYSSFSDHSWLMVLWVVFSCLLLQTIQ